MIDVVGAEDGPHQLLEEVRLLVGALRGTEAGQRPGAVGALDGLEPGCDEVQRLVPGRLAEGGQNLGVVSDSAGAGAPSAPAVGLAVAADLGRERPLGVELRTADERFGEALFVQGVVPAVAALDAEAGLVAGAVAALGPEDAVVLDVVGQRAADAAV